MHLLAGLLSERVLSRIVASPGPLDTECWLWTGPTYKGYAKATVGGTTRRLHKVIYELLVGPVPEGRQLDHLCRRRHCVRPTHLEAVTSQVNSLRGVGLPARNAAKTHCRKGHVYDQANTIHQSGKRMCRTCMNDWKRAHR